MNKTKKRTLFVALVCVLVLVLSLGIMTACNGNNDVENIGSTTGGAWHYGASFPADEIGQVGDYYLNTKTLASYKKTANGWSTVSMEESGKWYYGVGAPSVDDGLENDFYLNIKTGDLYHKGSSGWGDPVLKLFGRDGVIWFSGNVDPEESDDVSLGDAIEGDFYLNYNNSDFTVWQMDSDGVWQRLGSLKGDKGEDAKDPVQFYNGEGEPDGNVESPNEGDLYIGVFDGLNGKGAGSRLYRYLEGEWVVLMDNVKEGQVEVGSIEKLAELGQLVAAGNSFEGQEIHLKSDIDLQDAEWTPIGTEDAPFKGGFDFEGHTVSNLSLSGDADSANLGLIGYADGASFKNVTISNVTVNGSSNVGVLFGTAKNSTVENVVVEGDIDITGDSAGVIAGDFSGKISNVRIDPTVESEVSGTTDAGAICGKLQEGSSIDGAYINTNGMAESSYINGDRALYNTQPKFVVSGDKYVGGVVGELGANTTISTVGICGDIVLYSENPADKEAPTTIGVVSGVMEGIETSIVKVYGMVKVEDYVYFGKDYDFESNGFNVQVYVILEKRKTIIGNPKDTGSLSVDESIVMFVPYGQLGWD